MASMYKRTRELRRFPTGRNHRHGPRQAVREVDGREGEARRAPLNAGGDAWRGGQPYIAHTPTRTTSDARPPREAKTKAKLCGRRTTWKSKYGSGGRAKSTPRRNATARKPGGPSSEHLADFRQYLPDKGNTEQHVAQTTRQVQVNHRRGPRGTHRGP